MGTETLLEIVGRSPWNWTEEFVSLALPTWIHLSSARFIRRKKKKKRKSGDEADTTSANNATTSGQNPRESEEMSKSMMTILVGYLDFDSVNIREVTLLGFAKLLLHDRIVSGWVACEWVLSLVDCIGDQWDKLMT